MAKDRDEIQVRLDNNKCPKCLAELNDDRNEEVRKCGDCGQVISTPKVKDD